MKKQSNKHNLGCSIFSIKSLLLCSSQHQKPRSRPDSPQTHTFIETPTAIPTNPTKFKHDKTDSSTLVTTDTLILSNLPTSKTSTSQTPTKMNTCTYLQKPDENPNTKYALNRSKSAINNKQVTKRIQVCPTAHNSDVTAKPATKIPQMHSVQLRRTISANSYDLKTYRKLKLSNSHNTSNENVMSATHSDAEAPSLSKTEQNPSATASTFSKAQAAKEFLTKLKLSAPITRSASTSHSKTVIPAPDPSSPTTQPDEDTLQKTPKQTVSDILQSMKNSISVNVNSHNLSSNMKIKVSENNISKIQTPTLISSSSKQVKAEQINSQFPPQTSISPSSCSPVAITSSSAFPHTTAPCPSPALHAASVIGPTSTVTSTLIIKPCHTENCTSQSLISENASPPAPSPPSIGQATTLPSLPSHHHVATHPSSKLESAPPSPLLHDDTNTVATFPRSSNNYESVFSDCNLKRFSGNKVQTLINDEINIETQSCQTLSKDECFALSEVPKKVERSSKCATTNHTTVSHKSRKIPRIKEAESQNEELSQSEDIGFHNVPLKRSQRSYIKDEISQPHTLKTEHFSKADCTDKDVPYKRNKSIKQTSNNASISQVQKPGYVRRKLPEQPKPLPNGLNKLQSQKKVEPSAASPSNNCKSNEPRQQITKSKNSRHEIIDNLHSGIPSYVPSQGKSTIKRSKTMSSVSRVLPTASKADVSQNKSPLPLTQKASIYPKQSTACQPSSKKGIPRNKSFSSIERLSKPTTYVQRRLPDALSRRTQNLSVKEDDTIRKGLKSRSMSSLSPLNRSKTDKTTTIVQNSKKHYISLCH